MATPLASAPLERRAPQSNSRNRGRVASGAGLAALAVVAAVAASPSVALAQDQTLTDANAWAIEQVQAPAAWETTRGEGITVAVMDSGVAPHPFFEDKDILPGYSGFTDEEDGWGDVSGHGSSVIAGVLHVAPEATILPVRTGTGADIGFGGATGPKDYEAMRWAVDNGADIVVMAWGISGGDPTDDELEAIQYLIDKGAVVVAAAGNDPGIDVTYPASVPGVVAVSGTDTSGNAWYGNTTGPEVVIAAPADEMLHPVPQDPTALGDRELYEESFGGTSVGSGMVAGVAALTWAAHQDLDASNVIQRLIQTAGDGSGSNRTEELGFGLVNADQAVHADGIETVDENPLGYPMGEPGASGASPDEEASAEESAGAGPGAGEPSRAAEEVPSPGLSTIIVIAAAVVLVGAAIAVWLVLRGRSRKQGLPGGGQPGGFNPEGPQAPSGYGSSGPNQPQYSPPTGPGQEFGSPYGGNQRPQYGPPSGGAEPSPPWGPSGTHERR